MYGSLKAAERSVWQQQTLEKPRAIFELSCVDSEEGGGGGEGGDGEEKKCRPLVHYESLPLDEGREDQTSKPASDVVTVTSLRSVSCK